jgi:hypothetical protein
MWIVFWIVMALVVAVVASGKGRSGIGWFFYGLLLWPVALAHICVLRRPEPARAIADTAPASTYVPSLRPIDYVRPSITAGPAREWSFLTSYRSKIRGVTKDNEDGVPRQELIADLSPGDLLTLRREPTNPHDPNAIRVLSPKLGTLGYVGADLAVTLAPLVDDPSIHLVVRVLDVTGGEQGRFLGVNFDIGQWRAVAIQDRAPRAEAVDVAPPSDRNFSLPELPDLPPPPVKSKILPGVVGIALLIAALFVMVRLNAPADSLPPRAATPVAPPVPGPPIRVLAEASLIAGPFTQAGGRGLTRGEIAELQATLNRIGLDVGAADGVAGPRTRAALREIERQAGWGPAEAPVAAHLEWARMRAR